MADFFQSKPIITLPSLCKHSHLEAKIKQSAKKIVVVVPCSTRHYILGTIHNLLNQLQTVSFVHQIIVILNGESAELEYDTKDLFNSIEPYSTIITALSLYQHLFFGGID